MNPPQDVYKVKDISKGGALGKYRAMMYGDMSAPRALLAECLTALLGNWPGAVGLALRQKCYPLFFPNIGKKVVFGRNVTIRHPHKIRIGDRVIFDDNVLIDAKGQGNAGLTIGDDVYVGRHTSLYCKGGDIILGKRVNISSSCTVFSSHRVAIGEGCVIGAYTYILSGGEYDHRDPTPFCLQTGMRTKGPTEIGPDCWLGARVTILDGVLLGERCVVAAAAVVTHSAPAHSLLAGLPAKVIKRIVLSGAETSAPAN